MRLPAPLLCLLSLASVSSAVKRENFKTCDQSGFCKRNRVFADRAFAAGPTFTSPYELDPLSLSLSNGVLAGTIWKTVSERDGGKVELPLKISLLDNGVARVTIDEKRRRDGRIELRGDSPARKERYNEAEEWVLVGGRNFDKKTSKKEDDGTTVLNYGPAGSELRITHKPFGIAYLKDGETQVVLNERNLLNVDHWRPKREGEDMVVGEDDDPTLWEESFGGNTDSKPRGPESVALDITFPGFDYVYGIPEHASSLSLKETRGGDGNYDDPYRLYNSDVFEYEVDSPMTLYGAIPFMQAHKPGSTVGIFWLNGAETWIDVVRHTKNPAHLSTEKRSTHTHWISESGLLDVFILPGPDAVSLYKQYGELTGYTALPQMFAIAYHQCRWNYVSQDDVKNVDKNFDKYDIPYDVIWLDIEYTDDKKYFTWDPLTFSDPVEMQTNLAKRDRKLVAIIDPHIKNLKDYNVGKELEDKELAVREKSGNKIYEGWCWPGSSHWVDCFNPAAIKWWKGLFNIKSFPGATKNLHIWNDMNEPSVFNGPETTMPKDNLHFGGWEHRDVHNINGMTFHNATWEGMVVRLGKGKEERPFVLTRSFFAGSQRSAAMWTGDNQASFSHLQQAFPMILSQGISGMPFSGADVGGFFGNPSKELFTRWYQAGAFYPFFRGHAHIDAKRREPYLFEDPYISIVRDAIRLRYQLLPAWYTAFHRSAIDGMPVLRPHFVMFPEDEQGFELDDQFFLGETGLLVKPVVTEGTNEVDLYIPDDEPYYNFFDFTLLKGKGVKQVPAPLDTIPLFARGGHIVPRRDRHRRSSGLMKHDPYTLLVSLSNAGVAGGPLYMDDGETFNFKKGEYILRGFTFQSNTLSSQNLHPEPSKAYKYEKQIMDVRVEKIIILGVPTEWKDKTSVVVKNGGLTWECTMTVEGSVDGKVAYATLRDPKIPIAGDWEIVF